MCVPFDRAALAAHYANFAAMQQAVPIQVVL